MSELLILNTANAKTVATTTVANATNIIDSMAIPRSMAQPIKNGLSAVLNTINEENSDRMVPITSVPYNSAHNAVAPTNCSYEVKYDQSHLLR